MKRAIYVGKPWLGLAYGMTGYIRPEEDDHDWAYPNFRPDGCIDSARFGVPRADLYIPTEDQQRHCPNQP